MPSLKDIARHANVSSCTVSRYLNKDIVVKKETEARIKKAIAELGYVPNVVAKALRNNRTANIAVVLPKINNLYYSEMTAGISEILGQQHYNLFIYERDTLQLNEEEIIQMMRENMVAGVIFIGMSYDMSFKESLHRLLEWEIPVVYMNRAIADADFPVVYPDFYQAGRLAAQHLQARGKQKIALLHRHQRKELIAAYLESFRQVYEGVSPFVLEITEDEDFSAACVKELQQQNIDGVFVLNEMYAVKLARELLLHHIKVPEEVAVMGFGNSLMSQIAMPELTAIDLQNRKLGNISAQIILSQIEKTEFAQQTVVAPCIIQRQST